MTDPQSSADLPPAPPAENSAAQTAGAMLRQARQAQGLHIAALAAAIKVSPRKLDMLESDRFDELPDATFTRALAQTVCRALKIDAEPVLARMPAAQQAQRLEQMSRGLNAPFRDRDRRNEGFDWRVILRPAVWGPLLLVLGAAAVYLLPPGTWRMPDFTRSGANKSPAAAESSATVTTTLPAFPAAASAVSAAPAATSEPVADAASAAGASAGSGGGAAQQSVPAPAVSGAASAPANIATAPTPAPAATAPTGPLVLRASGESWVEVRDAGGQVLLSRALLAGETVGLEGAAPLRLKIGNAEGTQLSYRGKPVELTPYTRDNVARLELK